MAAVQLAGWRAAFPGIVPNELEPTAEHLIERLRAHSADPSRSRVVAELDGAPVGFCAFGPSRDADGAGVGEIHALFVDPPSWRRKAGTALVARALHELRTRGFDEVTLWSFAQGARANAFYERCGFSRDGGEQSVPELGHAPEVRLRRSLASPPR
ncbi:MAG: N-acetyltransferase family protein [Nocardioidaceae bacterium]